VDFSLFKTGSHLLYDIVMNLLVSDPEVRLSSEDVVSILDNPNVTVSEFLKKNRKKRSQSRDKEK
jgi:hypothetical protein